MYRTIARLAALTALATALLAPSAGASTLYNDGQDDAFVIAGFGVCYYPADRPADYFGVNVRCPRDPMPPDSHPWVDNGTQSSAGYPGSFGICWYGDTKSDH